MVTLEVLGVPSSKVALPRPSQPDRGIGTRRPVQHCYDRSGGWAKGAHRRVEVGIRMLRQNVLPPAGQESDR